MSDPLDLKNWTCVHSLESSDDDGFLGIRIFVNGEECKFSYDYTVDWQGWKEIRVPFTQFQVTGGATWNKVQEIALPLLVGNGGNYYIDDMRIVKDGA